MDAPECPGCRERDVRIADRESRLLPLEGVVRDLQDRLKSPPGPRPAPSLPPAPAKKPTGKKPGHPPLLRTLLGTDRVNRVVPLPSRDRSTRRGPPP